MNKTKKSLTKEENELKDIFKKVYIDLSTVTSRMTYVDREKYIANIIYKLIQEKIELFNIKDQKDLEEYKLRLLQIWNKTRHEIEKDKMGFNKN